MRLLLAPNGDFWRLADLETGEDICSSLSHVRVRAPVMFYTNMPDPTQDNKKGLWAHIQGEVIINGDTALIIPENHGAKDGSNGSH